MQTDFFDYVDRQIKKARGINWIWTGAANEAPGQRASKWLEYFTKDYIPGAEDVCKFTPDAGTEFERLMSGVNAACQNKFAEQFGVGISGVHFSLSKAQPTGKGINISSN